MSLLGGSFSWALGSVLSKRWQTGMDIFSATAWQVTAAGISNFLWALAAGDLSRVVWTRRGVGAVAYLVVCGSWIGYTAYIWLLEHVPTSKVSTYAYVNPVVAVFLGWLILHEKVDRFIFWGKRGGGFVGGAGDEREGDGERESRGGGGGVVVDGFAVSTTPALERGSGSFDALELPSVVPARSG